ncbi:hypothetical protein [Bradyrhizobium sp. USDA 4473]
MSLFDIARNNIALAAPVALILVAGLSPAARLLSARWLVFLGEASLALYLIHIIIFRRFPVVRWETASQLLGHIGALALAFALAACAAILLHFGFEVPTAIVAPIGRPRRHSAGSSCDWELSALPRWLVRRPCMHCGMRPEMPSRNRVFLLFPARMAAIAAGCHRAATPRMRLQKRVMARANVCFVQIW